MDNEESLKSVYSYHTFLFPFLLSWADDGKKQDGSDDYMKFITYIKKDSCWIETVLGDSTANDAQYMEEYATYRYYNNNGKNLLTGDNGEPVSRFVFEKSNSSKSSYRIYYNNNDEKGYYDLEIRKITLNVYSSTVAVLRYDLSFYHEGKYIWNEKIKEYQWDTEKPKPMDVNRINEQGRRIYVPFIKSDNEGEQKKETSDSDDGNLTANKIALIIDREDSKSNLILECDFDEINKKLCNHIDNGFREEYKNNYIPAFIVDLINYKKKNKNSEYSQKKIKPVAILDDRMFVGCLLKDDKFINSCQEYLEDKHCYGYLHDQASEDLYQFCYIETFLTCQSKVSRERILKKTIYDRWIDLSTLHGVTHHSFVCLTTTDAYMDSVVKPFITSYMDMAVMVVIQRATLLALSNRATDIASRIPSSGRLKSKLIYEIQKLHGEFIKYKNQILLFEVTPQEQGVELFDKLRDEMYIEKELERVNDNIHHLGQLAESESSGKLNKIMFTFAAIAIAIALFSLAVSLLSAPVPIFYAVVCALLATVIILYFIWKWVASLKRRWSKNS